MSFSKRKIGAKKSIKTTYAKKRTYTTKKKSGSRGILKFLLWSMLLFLSISLLGGVLLYQKYIKGLPSITELENLEIAQSSTIYDRNGKELYSIYEEKRTYVEFDDINKNMINAIVAGEDKRYWENAGVDLIGIMRAVLNYGLGKTPKIEGTSTLTQQLVRNTIIANERKIERKIKEIYLSYQLSQGLSKEKVLELYLNKISYGSNAFGIEQAAKTFFAKSASELNIFESSILASLPKGPTYYSPYNHSDRILGYLYIYEEGSEEVDAQEIFTNEDIINNQAHIDEFKKFFGGLKASRLIGSNKMVLCGIDPINLKNSFQIDNDGCGVIEYSTMLHFLNSIQITYENKIIEYQTGRKDFILGRMLEDNYINFKEYQEAILNSFAYEFQQAKEDIKAPHFVFFVKEYLEETYGEDVVSMGGLKIYTTLDLDLQEEAERIIEKQAKINESKFDAKSAALISIDNKTGEIITMVGGRDYFDRENKGNVNIITSRIQPGSIFKPFVYAMGIYENEIGTKTPIYDVKTKFPGGYTPENFDTKFMGKMNIATALNNSRNIPAIKMLYLAGGERAVVNFMNKLGVASLKHGSNYGAPLSLGTGEMTALELATAYSIFANLGVKKDITPILKIEDAKGNIIEEFQNNKGEKIISEAQTYIINSMLSDASTRPAGWNSFLTLKNRPVAAKTGTSTKQYERYGKKEVYPRNLWTAGYTPQITTVVWAGNPNGKKLHPKGTGLEGAGPIWKQYMEFAHKGKPVLNWKQPYGVKNVNISTVSGLLPSPELSNSEFITSSLFLNTPTKFDSSQGKVKVDALCYGKVTVRTPEAAIKEVTLLQFHSLSPTNPSWEDPVQEWVKSEKAKEIYGNITNLITSINNIECERSSLPSDIVIKSKIEANSNLYVGDNYIELAYKSSNPIIKLDILLDNTVVEEIELKNKNIGTYVGTVFIPSKYANTSTQIKLRAVDTEYYSSEEVNTVNILSKDRVSPIIKVINPIDYSIKVYNDEFFNFRAEITDNSGIRTINIDIDDKNIKMGLTDKNITIPISGSTLTLGEHTLTITAIDNNLNKSVEEIKVEVIER